MESIVQNLMCAALMECCPPALVKFITRHPLFRQARTLAVEDLRAFTEKDPASHGRAGDIAYGYTSFKAVLHYRLAHMLFQAHTKGGPHRQELRDAVMLISLRGKLLSGAEIHPACTIGRRFILDHGYGTVIGETTCIGDDGYLLGGVVLGATGIASNPRGKRHPTVGHRVQIGAFARIFGDVVIGDDVFISSHCMVKEDIPSGAVVSLKSEIQIVRRKTPSGYTFTRPVYDTAVSK